MHEITIEAEVRNEIGKGIRGLRRMGKIPGVFYIHGEQNITLAVPEKSLKSLIYSQETHIINLTLNNGVNKKCILRDVQFDPVTERPLHFDVQGLREDEEITLEVPIIITGGIPQGVRDGGILQHFVHRLKISCLPKHIPDHIEVNAEQIKMNQFVHAGDLKVENVKILENETNAIVGVIPPVVEKEEVAAAVEETVEPEVIGKGKKVDEEGAPVGGEAKPAAKPAEAKEEKEGKEEKKKK